MTYNKETMDPKETSKPIRSSRSIDAVAKRASSTSPAASRPPVAISSKRSGNVIDLRKPASEPKPVEKPELKTTPGHKAKPKKEAAKKAEPIAAALPMPSGSAPRRKFWPAFGRFIILLIVLSALIAGAYYVYITYYHT